MVPNERARLRPVGSTDGTTKVGAELIVATIYGGATTLSTIVPVTLLSFTYERTVLNGMGHISRTDLLARSCG